MFAAFAEHYQIWAAEAHPLVGAAAIERGEGGGGGGGYGGGVGEDGVEERKEEEGRKEVGSKGRVLKV